LCPSVAQASEVRHRHRLVPVRGVLLKASGATMLQMIGNLVAAMPWLDLELEMILSLGPVVHGIVSDL
jgi:hypothetical protein